MARRFTCFSGVVGMSVGVKKSPVICGTGELDGFGDGHEVAGYVAARIKFVDLAKCLPIFAKIARISLWPL